MPTGKNKQNDGNRGGSRGNSNTRNAGGRTGDMSVREAGQKGGQRERELVQQGKQSERGGGDSNR